MFSTGGCIDFFIGRRKYGSTVRILLEILLEGTALHSLRIFLFVVCVGSTSHAAAARDVVVGMSETLLSSRDRKRGIVGSTGEGGSVRFGSCATSVK